MDKVQSRDALGLTNIEQRTMGYLKTCSRPQTAQDVGRYLYETTPEPDIEQLIDSNRANSTRGSNVLKSLERRGLVKRRMLTSKRERQLWELTQQAAAGAAA